MFKIDIKSKKSIYEQIVDGFKGEIVSGERAPDSKLPSVRDLAATLTVNPNTIQKAYQELLNQGFIYSVSGRGNFVSGDRHSVDPVKVEKLLKEISSSINELRYLGLDDSQIKNEIESLIIKGSFEERDNQK